MDELSEETKERYRRWWTSRSTEERAQLRALNGQPVSIHELVFLADSDGFPLATGPREPADPTELPPVPPGSPPAVFLLPDFLLDHKDEGGPTESPVG